MSRELRYSPSGEIVANEDGGAFIPGQGMVMRAVFSQASISDGYTLSGSTPIEIKEDPDTTTAPFMRPELQDCQLGAFYGAEGSIMLRKRDAWDTDTVTFLIEGSIDSGANWMQLSSTRLVIPGDAGVGNGEDITFNFEVPAVAGSDITGLAGGGSLMLRAQISKPVPNDGNLSFAGQPNDTKSASGVRLKITEQF